MTRLMKSTNILLVAASLSAVTAMAQDLTKEITIEKEIVPEQRAATRLNATPRLLQPEVKQRQLTMSDRSTASTVPAMVDRLEPARAAADTAADSRGYVAAGYFPTYNLALSAGYRIVDNAATGAEVWMQFDGLSYKEKNLMGDKLTYKRNTLSLGGDFTHRLNSRLTLDASAAYSFMSVSRPWYESADDQGIHRLWVDAAVRGRSQQCEYSLGAEGGYTGFTRGGRLPLAVPASDADLKAIGEIDFGVNGGVSSLSGDGNRFGLNLSARFNRYNRFNRWRVAPDGDIDADWGGSEMLGVVTLNPYWMIAAEEFNATIGVDVDLAVNSGRFANVAPHAGINWTPRMAGSMLSLFATATGGVSANTLGSLLDYTPYVDPLFSYEHSRVPVDVIAGVTVGPYRGTALTLRGGYSIANDWLMPVVVDGSNLWHAVDLKGWRAGASLTHRSRWIKELTVSYDYAPNSGDKGYYMWRDHARHVLDADVTVSPIKPLDVTLGFESRWNRSSYAYSTAAGEGSVSLGCSNNLSVGGLYRFTDKLSFFLRGENLLNTKSYMLFDIPAQGITGLLGATYKF